MTLFDFICIAYFSTIKPSDQVYSQPIREVEQLSTDYYLGPTIDKNNNISNIIYSEHLDSI